MTKSRFPKRAMSELVDRISNPVEVEQATKYEQIGIRSHGKGIFYKEPVTGKALGNKRVFWVEPDCFAVNIVFAWEQAVAKTTQSDVGKIASHRFPMFRPKSRKADLDFLLYLFKTKLGKHLLTLASPGGAGRNKTLGQSEFLKIEIPCPPYDEQVRIAQILSTWDRSIEKTGNLIAKGEAQKKAFIQRLLTGKTRLPGFSEEWQEFPLTAVADVIVSNVDKKSNEDELPVRLCNYTDVYSRNRIEADQSFMRATATEAQVQRYGLKVGDVVITKDSERPDDIAVPTFVASAAPDLICGYHLAIIRPGGDVVGQFLKYLFEETRIRHYFAARANGVTRFGLTLGTLEEAKFRLPCKDEQAAIASVLRTSEREIEALKQDYSNLEAERDALMQQLLTGKRRVKIEKEAAA